MNTKPLVILEMANNHQGNLEHGLRIIEHMAEIVQPFRFEFDFAVKLQLRHLATFIHPDYRDSKARHVERFIKTELKPEAYFTLTKAIRQNQMIPMATPFDEPSVLLFESLGLDILKVGSCSFSDWPLWERIANHPTGTKPPPIIASTGGVSWAEIDAVVQFCRHRGRDLTLLHCVGEYPTPPSHANVGQVGLLRQRYGLRVGISSHEDRVEPPVSALVAIGQGATVFERHVAALGCGAVNDYSLTRYEVQRWLLELRTGFTLLGIADKRYIPDDKELDSLRSLQRGVWAAEDMQFGETAHAVTFAIPAQPGQYTANDWGKWRRFEATKPIAAGEPISVENVAVVDIRPAVIQAMERVRAFVRGEPIPADSELELSHHYGLDRFYDAGCAIITVINREYCKKLIILLPGQAHPEQYHEEKTETFHIQRGTVTVWLDGVENKLTVGQALTIERGVKHRMSSTTGCIIEEISTNHKPGDSYYTDPAIMANRERKTRLPYWME